MDRAEELSPLTGLLRRHYAALAWNETNFWYCLHRLHLKICPRCARSEHLLLFRILVRGPLLVVINELNFLPAICPAHSLLSHVGLRCMFVRFKKILFRSDSIFKITAHIGCLNRVVGDVIRKCGRLVHLRRLARFKDLRTCIIVVEAAGDFLRSC